uniref:YbaK/aminoacyl-tRNA synthetase-associated domain-containing protein n=3 Tax=Ditylum brightwellii TaxID=49249 RepID=A0A7S4QWN6_9STRA|mmetsp:Transcript_2424/g.2635  ORF Transcript_2424/g.2635 Transcript_2424/m.2635 type:complete len:229 (-) Transcript_2424:147-833(-)
MNQRITKLENKLWNIPGNDTHNRTVDESMRRVRSHIESSNSCFSVQYNWVPPNYYALSLLERAKILGAHSTFQLCKAMLMENKKYDASNSLKGGDGFDRTNSQFYLIVVQYEGSINANKLASEIRALRSVSSKTRLDPNAFDFRVAKEEDNDALTGFRHNAVSPFGILESKKVPIVLSKDIIKVTPKFIFMGGGHVDLKVGMAVDEFIKSTDAIVVDISDPRSSVDEE